MAPAFPLVSGLVATGQSPFHVGALRLTHPRGPTLTCRGRHLLLRGTGRLRQKAGLHARGGAPQARQVGFCLEGMWVRGAWPRPMWVAGMSKQNFFRLMIPCQGWKRKLSHLLPSNSPKSLSPTLASMQASRVVESLVAWGGDVEWR